MSDSADSTENGSIEQAKARWEREVLQPILERRPERRERFQTVSGLPVERLHVPETRSAAQAAEEYQQKLGFPGQYPFTRGVHPTGYRGRLWTMRQYAGFSTAEESNRRYHYLLEQGSTGLSIAFDLPTQIGYDSDDPLAEGEVGKVGVAIDTLADMETLLDGIPLAKVSTSMTINSTAAILLAMYIAVAEKQGVRPAQLTGTLQNDILKEYIARGTYRFPPRPSLRLVSDIFTYCTAHVPKWNMISISGYHIREAGATAAQEIGFTLADAICYVQTALDAGLELDAFAPRLAFFFAAHTDVLEEIAKFRAARRLYARLMRERFGAKDPRSCMLRFHTQTGGVTLTAQQPDNNVVRVTLQALAAVLGGTQSLHTNSKDEALSLPAEQNVQLALRTQQIIAEESGIANTVDPLGGSYFIERLTDQIEAEAQACIDRIDEMGGMANAIEQGWVQRQIEQAAYEFGQAMERGERVIVGVNKYQSSEATPIDTFEVCEDTQQHQIEKLQEVRRQRDQAAVDRTLAAIEAGARGDEPLMPLILEAVRAYASVGEICRAMEKVFGEYEQP
ncbi:MAG: acyl-CoA mutase large subunit family protein, partial [Phycisphaeraceae bacterium]